MNIFEKLKTAIAPTTPTDFPMYMAEIDPAPNSDLEVNFIGLVDRPAIERNFQAFRTNKVKAGFAIDEDKRIISGPAMIADMPLFRNDQQLGEYYVVFNKASIRAIVEKFAAKGFMQKFNLFHDDQQQVSDVTIFNSFITDTSLGIQPPAGFEDVADGSWFISAKVNNDAVWEKVKDGTIKGFSVEGLFAYNRDQSGLPKLSPAPKLAADAAKEASIERSLTEIKGMLAKIVPDMQQRAAAFNSPPPALPKPPTLSFTDLTGKIEARTEIINGLLNVMDLMVQEENQRGGTRKPEVSDRYQRKEARVDAIGVALKEIREES